MSRGRTRPPLEIPGYEVAAIPGCGSLRRSLGGRRSKHGAARRDQVLHASRRTRRLAVGARGREAGVLVGRSLRGPATRCGLGCQSAVLRDGLHRERLAGRSSAAAGTIAGRTSGGDFPRGGHRVAARTRQGCAALRPQTGQRAVGPGSSAAVGGLRPVTSVARADAGAGNVVLHGPGTSRPAGCARRALGCVCSGRPAALHADGRSPAPQHAGRFTDRLDAESGSATQTLPGTDPPSTSPGTAQTGPRSGSCAGRDRAAVPGRRSRVALRQRAECARRAAAPRRAT